MHYIIRSSSFIIRFLLFLITSFPFYSSERKKSRLSFFLLSSPVCTRPLLPSELVHPQKLQSRELFEEICSYNVPTCRYLCGQVSEAEQRNASGLHLGSFPLRFELRGQQARHQGVTGHQLPCFSPPNPPHHHRGHQHQQLRILGLRHCEAHISR